MRRAKAARSAEDEERRAEQTLIARPGPKPPAPPAPRPSAPRSLPRWKRKSAAWNSRSKPPRNPQRQADAGLAELGDGVALTANVAEARGRTADARTPAGEARARAG